MSLNPTQRKLLAAGLLLLIFMGLFPPYTYTYEAINVYSEVPAKYSFILTPPERKYNNARHGVKLDLARLVIQSFIVVLASGLGILLSSNPKNKLNR